MHLRAPDELFIVSAGGVIPHPCTGYSMQRRGIPFENSNLRRIAICKDKGLGPTSAGKYVPASQEYRFRPEQRFLGAIISIRAPGLHQSMQMFSPSGFEANATV